MNLIDDPLLTMAQRYLLAREVVNRNDSLSLMDLLHSQGIRFSTHRDPRSYTLHRFADGSTLVLHADQLSEAGWVIGHPRHRIPREAQ